MTRETHSSQGAGKGRGGERVNREITITSLDGLVVLDINGETVPIKDYKISSSMRGGTELEVVIKLDGNIMEFATSANLGR